MTGHDYRLQPRKEYPATGHYSPTFSVSVLNHDSPHIPWLPPALFSQYFWRYSRLVIKPIVWRYILQVRLSCGDLT